MKLVPRLCFTLLILLTLSCSNVKKNRKLANMILAHKSLDSVYSIYASPMGCEK